MVQHRSDRKNIFWLSLGSGRSYYHLSTFSNLRLFSLNMISLYWWCCKCISLQNSSSDTKSLLSISLTPSATQLVPKPKSAARGKGAPTPDELVNILGVYSDKRPPVSMTLMSSTHLRRKISPDSAIASFEGRNFKLIHPQVAT